MYCINCGKQLPDNTRFCDNCGTQQQSNEGAAINEKVFEVQGQSPKKGVNIKKNIIVVLAIALCAFMIGKFVIAPSMMNDTENSSETTNKNSQPEQITENSEVISSAVNNPAYESVFKNTNILHFQFFFGMDMANFALKQDDGIVCCVDYGYENDIVKQWVETVYIPVSDYTEAQKTELENTMRSEFASVEALSCCSVNYEMSMNYLTVTCTYSDLDKKENYQELYEANMLELNAFISMSATEESLINQGYAKK